MRVGALIPKDRFRVIQRGADEAVGEILDIVRSGNANFVAVFDPFGFNEGSEESWARLLRERDHGDLIATFQTKMAVRHTAKSIAPLVGPSVLDGHEDEHLTTEAALKAFTESVGRYRRSCRQYAFAPGIRPTSMTWSTRRGLAEQEGSGPTPSEGSRQDWKPLTGRP